ncbi:MAG: ATP-binding protein [Ignavibacteriota bacterium]|nr:ATP-binding protein [Ignavibacteriales bacterium]MBL1122791.1 ATP-binding protein [Ignavibacteriota bacterium]MCC7094260.1 ATP-binding protein [Ignavibacteriaceae bacterium]MCE7855812.1 ATP-binding protein [Ignavibacteria bacterium CHB3]MEB2296316.1 ATP-binding protein [Ignavibacteria bacterium]
MPEPFYQLEIESDPNNLITVEEFVNYFAKDLGLSDEQLSVLLLAVTEATTNAIIHANKCDIKKLVTIHAHIEDTHQGKHPQKLIVKIKDEGKGFDPAALPNPTEPENLLKDSGRGVFLMKVYMSDVKYNITPTGMETILILNL